MYSLSPDDKSLWRRKVQTEAEHFKDVSGLVPADIARLVHADGCHIIINLNGYTKGSANEVFALQPAPLAVNALGFPGTTGAG